MRCVAEVSSFNLMYNLCMYYEKQKSYDKTELTFQPTLVGTTQHPSLSHLKATSENLLQTMSYRPSWHFHDPLITMYDLITQSCNCLSRRGLSPRESEREWGRQTGRQTYRQGERQTDRQTETKAKGQRCRMSYSERKSCGDKHNFFDPMTDSHTDRQTVKEKEREIR